MSNFSDESENSKKAVKNPEAMRQKAFRNSSDGKFGFYSKGVQLILYHRTARNRQLKISLGEDMSIAEYYSYDSNNEKKWAIPCDITGLCNDVVSGTKPQKRPMRVRVHPSTMRVAQESEEFAELVANAALELVTQLLSGDWSLCKPILADIRKQHICNFRKLFGNGRCYVFHKCNCILLNWPFEDSAEKALASESLQSALVLEVEQNVDNISGHQKVYIRFVKDDMNEILMCLIISANDSSNWLTYENTAHQIELNQMHLAVRLQRSTVDETELPVRTCDSLKAYVPDDSNELKEVMIEDSQKSLQKLRERLDDSIQAYQRRQKSLTASKIASQKQRPLMMLSKDENTTCIQISGSKPMRISKTKVEKVIKQTRGFNSASSSPLQVIVGTTHDSSNISSECITGSPEGSIDSGIYSMSPTNSSLSSSSSSSPNSSPISIHTTPFLYNHATKDEAQTRVRSVSECAGVTLKGILKKATPINVIKGRFTRTCSESQDVDVKDMDVVGIIDKSEDYGESRRQKRVSFSDRLVQERSFRPNSSILGQKKKNQRKQRNKMKKRLGATSEESLSNDDEGRARSDSEASHEEVFGDLEDGVDSVTCDLDGCNLEDNNEMKSCHNAAATVDEFTNRAYPSSERPRVFFTIGDDLCQC